jgi:hypothetical protein
MMPMKYVTIAFLICLIWSSAGRAEVMNYSPVPGAIVGVDWQGPPQLPPSFRNHCSIDRLSGRVYCSDHCGIDYQFYYCTPASFGCCHIGHGYCDWDGLLRCHP